MQEAGRKAVLEAGAIPLLTSLLQTPDLHVHARVAGALHNLSSHQEAVRAIHRADAIPRLVELLRWVCSCKPATVHMSECLRGCA